MTLKEFCDVWDFQYPNGIARVEVKNKDHFVFEDSYVYPDEILHLITSNKTIANLRVVRCYIYDHIKMDFNHKVKTLRIETEEI